MSGGVFPPASPGLTRPTLALCAALLGACASSARPAASASTPRTAAKAARTKAPEASSQQQPASTNARSATRPTSVETSLIGRQDLVLGGPHSIALEAMAPDGSWLAYCQPTQDTNGDGALRVGTNARGERTGDVPDVHLALGSGIEQVDELLAFDASGRWLVVRTGDQAWLVDALSNRRVDLAPLAPDLRSDERFEVAHRSFSFDRNGERLLVLSHRSQFRYEAHLLELPRAAEPDVSQARKVSIPPGEVWRVQLAPDGALLTVDTILHDPAQRGNYRWPAPFRDEPIRRCRGLLAQGGAWAHRGGNVTTLVAPTSDPSLQAAPGFVLPVGAGWLRRERNGRLMLVKGGTQKQVASERCGARVLHADPVRELFLISCEHYSLDPKPDPPRGRKRPPPKTRFELYLVAPGFVGDLEADMAATNLDLSSATTPRLVPLRPGARSVLVDFDARRLHELQPDDRIVATYESRALVRRGRKLVLYDAATRREQTLDGSTAAFPTLRTNGAFAFVEPYLVDLSRSKVRLEHAGTPLAITSTGRLLVADVEPRGEAWARGPLSWIEAPQANGSAAPSGLPPTEPSPTEPPPTEPTTTEPTTTEPPPAGPPAVDSPPAGPAPSKPADPGGTAPSRSAPPAP